MYQADCILASVEMRENGTLYSRGLRDPGRLQIWLVTISMDRYRSVYHQYRGRSIISRLTYYIKLNYQDFGENILHIL